MELNNNISVDDYVKKISSVGGGTMKQKAVLIAGDSQRAFDQYLSKVPRYFITSNGERKPFPCRSGCSFCCYMPVHALEIEIILIAVWVFQTQRPEVVQRYQQKIVEARQKIGSARDDARMKLRVACPFLDEGSCGIYEVRPIACRAYFSPDAKACEVERDNPEKIEGQLMAKEPKQESESLFRQIVALAAKANVPCGMYDLIEGVYAAFLDPQFQCRVDKGLSGFTEPSQMYSVEYIVKEALSQR